LRPKEARHQKRKTPVFEYGGRSTDRIGQSSRIGGDNHPVACKKEGTKVTKKKKDFGWAGKGRFLLKKTVVKIPKKRIGSQVHERIEVRENAKKINPNVSRAVGMASTCGAIQQGSRGVP